MNLLEYIPTLPFVKSLKENTRLQHIAFWSLLVVIISLLNKSERSYANEMVIEIINVGFFAIIVYFNKLFLFPKYLEDKRFGVHLLWILLASVVITPIKTICLYFASTHPESKSFFVDSQYFIFVATFVVGAGSSIYYIMEDWLNGQREKQELTNQNLQSELKYLKSQINPHFLFNTLNSLYALTLKKSDLAPEIVLRLSEMMRYMLYECNEREVTLEKEVNYMINYLELEKLRHGKKLNINLNIDGDFSKLRIAPLLFIPFIENCFKHGLSNQISEGYVNIDFKVYDGILDIKIDNSKATALPSSGGKKSGGIGLANVKRRLELLYPKKYKLDISDQPNNYIVFLKLQLAPSLVNHKSFENTKTQKTLSKNYN